MLMPLTQGIFWSYVNKGVIEGSDDKPGPDYRLIGGHYACVDAVHLIKTRNTHETLCISGSRDRGMTVWSLSKMLDVSK